MSSELVVALWRDGEVQVEVGGRVLHRLPCSAVERYDVRVVARAGRRWLRAPGVGVAVIEAGGLVPGPPPPGDGHRPLSVWRVLPSGEVAVLHDGVALHRDGRWQWLSLPEGFEAQDADTAPSGALWLAGSLPATRVPGAEREAALLAEHDPGHFEPQPYRLGRMALARALAGGALEAYSHVNAGGDPVVAASRTAWFLEDPSSWVFAFGARQARLHRLANRTVRALIRRPDGCLAVTAEGDVTLVGSGRRTSNALVASNLERVLRRAAPDVPPAARVYLRGIAGWAIAAGLAVDDAKRVEWRATAVVLADEWTVSRLTRPDRGEPEVLDVG